jgi:hypothetical protein
MILDFSATGQGPVRRYFDKDSIRFGNFPY